MSFAKYLARDIGLKCEPSHVLRALMDPVETQLVFEACACLFYCAQPLITERDVWATHNMLSGQDNLGLSHLPGARRIRPSQNPVPLQL